MTPESHACVVWDSRLVRLQRFLGPLSEFWNRHFLMETIFISIMLRPVSQKVGKRTCESH